MDVTLEVEQLRKRFDRPGRWQPFAPPSPVLAVDGVSFTVLSGELFGLLGPNGAGKTTLVKMLCTLILPTSGRATIAGHDLGDDRAIRRRVGLVISDERSFFWRLDVRRNLQFFAALHGLYGRAAEDRIAVVLEEVDLGERTNQRFSELSSGMRQRLAIARALLHQPEILFLDEPTRSLDPLATQRIHALIQRLMAERPVTVFLITHDLAEAETLCRRVALMHEGKIRQIGQPAELRRQLSPRRAYAVSVNGMGDGALAALQRMPAAIEFVPRERAAEMGELRFQTAQEESLLADLLALLQAEGVHIRAIESSPPTLEEVFAHYTSGADRE